MQRSIIEMFSSIQGEGKYVGCRQVFVRFAGCNLACRYCDTENAPAKHPVCQVETHAGSRAFREEKTPLSLAQAAEEINRLLREVPHQAVRFTGGDITGLRVQLRSYTAGTDKLSLLPAAQAAAIVPAGTVLAVSYADTMAQTLMAGWLS